LRFGLGSHAGVSKDTVNRLSAPTASQVFAETLPGGSKPLQFLTVGSGDDTALVRAGLDSSSSAGADGSE
jgi:hypothetical protein